MGVRWIAASSAAKDGNKWREAGWIAIPGSAEGGGYSCPAARRIAATGSTESAGSSCLEASKDAPLAAGMA
jgi:hypothetical protein